MTAKTTTGPCRAVVEKALEAASRPRSSNAFTSTRADHALAEAEQLDRESVPRSPLHGVPVVVKDLFDVAGLPTTGGCAAYRDRMAGSDAAVVQALRAAGAVVVAKTNQHEMGAGATGLVSSFGPVTNPHDPERIAGGSSSGSAVAVAAGVVPLAIGTDTGGSIRIPASFCGITGLRPTPGRISLTGAQPMSPGYDTAGPMARTARECAAALAVFSGRGAANGEIRIHDPANRLRLGLPTPYFERVDPRVRDAVVAAAARFERMGARVDWVDRPEVDEQFEGFRHVWADVAHLHRDLWYHAAVSPEVRALIDVGRRMTGLDYARSLARARAIRDQFRTTLTDFDALLTPATPYPAPRVDDLEVAVTGGVLDVHRGGPSLLTVPVNEAGLSAVAFPVGTTADGLPLGAQLIGQAHADEQLLSTVAAFQEDLEGR